MSNNTHYYLNCSLSVLYHFSSGIPVVFIEYMATWKFYNAPPKECDNIFILLSDSEEILGNMTKLCDALDVCVNISFAYRTQTVQVKLFFFQILIYHFSKQRFLQYT